MPRHQNIIVNAGGATALSDGAVEAARVYCYNADVTLQATATNVAPTSREGAVPLAAGQLLAADMTLAELFPGVGAGALYLWAFSGSGVPTVVSVSHA